MLPRTPLLPSSPLPFPSSTARSPFMPSAPSGVCDLSPLALRPTPLGPPSSPCPPSSIVARCPRCPVYCQVMWDSRPHQTLVHLLHLLRSGVCCWGGGMCLRPGVRSARTSQTPTSGLGGEGSSDIMVCRQTAATSHHIVNDPISHWAYGTRCRARCTCGEAGSPWCGLENLK